MFNSPKNFKRGRFINNRYRVIDLVIALIGTIISLTLILIYLLVFNGRNIFIIGLITLPAIITLVLITPFSIYHNLLEFLKLYFIFFNSKKRYIWEGIYKYRIAEENTE